MSQFVIKGEQRRWSCLLQRNSIRVWCVMLSLSVAFTVMNAQTVSRVISGKVIDQNNESVIGASIRVKGTTVGTVTDLDGNFSLNVASGKVLVVSYMGYANREIEIKNQSALTIGLKEDTKALSEVLVVGYGVQKRSDITGAVSKLAAAEFKGMPLPSLHQALQGQIAGVSVVSNNGAPGGGRTVRVRGVGTMNDNNPLYVIDGMPTENGIYMVAPEDIESIEVLKDASATAIYGVKGANGVILVTTKRGTSTGEKYSAKVSLNVYHGVNTHIKGYDMMDATGFMNMYHEAYRTNPSGMNNLLKDKEGVLGEVEILFGNRQGTNWWKEITQVGHQQNYNLNLSGATDKLSYSTSVNYLNQQGIIKGSEYSRLNVRGAVDMKLNELLKTSFNINLSNEKIVSLPENGEGWSTPILYALQLDPMTPVTYDPYLRDVNRFSNELLGYDPSNPFSGYAATKYLVENGNALNPLGIIQRAKESSTSPYKALGNWALTLTPITGLEVKSNFGFDFAFVPLKTFSPKYNVDATVNPFDKNTNSTILQSYQMYLNWQWDNTVLYTKSIGKHSFSILGAFTIQENSNIYAGGMKGNILGFNEESKWIDAGSDTYAAFGSKNRSALVSYFGRGTYNYDNRYLLTATIRRDGSSRFAQKYRWGTFPSFSLGWRLDREGFMESIAEALKIDMFKLRGGWGLTGNERMRGAHQYVYTNTMSTGNGSSAVIGGAVMGGYKIDPKLANPLIQWETTEQLDIGVDMSFNDGLLRAELDFFNRNTRDMIVDYVPVPSFLGGVSSIIANHAKVRNTGFEATVTYSPRIKKDLRMDIKGIFSTSANKVTSFGGSSPFAGSWNGSLGDNLTRVDKGLPLGCFWGYQTDGIIQSEEQLASPALAHMRALGAQVGDLIFVDKDNSKTITSTDKGMIGTAIPTFTLGLKYDVSYKRFDFSMFFQGSFGNDILNLTKIYTHQGSGRFNAHSNLMNEAWSPSNPTNKQFAVSYRNRDNASSAAINARRLSDWYVEDGSYLRLKNIQVGYTIPFKGKKAAGSLRVYTSIQNLFTITNYSGIDPELGTNDPVNFGIDRAMYPQARTYTLGFSLNL